MISFNELLMLAGIDPVEVKLLRHGSDDPRTYDAWRNDRPRFEGYQSRQARREIPETGYVASFVVNRAGKNVFAGLYQIGGSTAAPEGDVDPLTGAVHAGRRIYDLTVVEGWAEYEGRLVIDWPPGSAGRGWHRKAASRIWTVLEIADQHDPWPGWRGFRCLTEELATLPRSWRDILSHTKGVYVLLDRDDGKQYVGSAKGTDSLLGRLEGYAGGGTNGNKGLTRGHRYQVAVLEAVGTQTPDETIEAIESDWKDKLGSRRPWGLNWN